MNKGRKERRKDGRKEGREETRLVPTDAFVPKCNNTSGILEIGCPLKLSLEPQLG